MASRKVVLERWRKAFPLAGFEPALSPPSEEDRRLAEQFCPQLYVDPKMVEEERADLTRHLGISERPGGRLAAFVDRLRSRDFTGVADALFLFRVGRFPEDLTGAKIGILAVDLPESNLPWDREMHRLLNNINERLRREYAEQYADYVAHLFSLLFPDESAPTCVLKYRVLRDAENSDFRCIQYFSYWPIQRFPYHLRDYEPIYLLARKSGKTFEPLLVAFNACTGARPILAGKRPGHTIRTFINWDSKDLQITPDEFNPMAEYMTRAYGGKYQYMPVPEDRRKSHLDQLLNPEGHLAFHVPKAWHAYDLCTPNLLREQAPLPCELHPLKTQDLLHIGWEVRNPFQSPFLYPTVGGKNALMHFPLTASTLWHAPTYRRWSNYALYEYHVKYGRPSKTISNIYSYRVGLFIDLFSELSGERMPWDIWPLIEARERELEGTLMYLKSLERRLHGKE